ncbi:MAG: methionine biosynthesis protein MetW [Elusimicrobiota bacterium]
MASRLKIGHRIVVDMVEPGSSVLDLGCGDGDLLSQLIKEKNVNGQGVEISQESVSRCVEKDINVFHGDLDTGLRDYPDQSFDYVLLNETLQEVKNIQYVLNESLRVGKKVIVSFPNFAFFKSRFMLFFGGKAPVTFSLPHQWFNTPNLHFWSIKDFKSFCAWKGVKILETAYFGGSFRIRFLPNLFASKALFIVSRQ